MVMLLRGFQFQLKLFLFCLLLVSCAASPQLPHLSQDAVILAFGDSLTYGSGVVSDQAYPAILSRLTAHKVVNAGVPGEVTEEGLARLPQLLDEVQPELIIICHGGNDILRRMSLNRAKDNIHAMVELSRAKGISVLLLSVPELGLFLSPPVIYQELADELNIPLESEVLSEVLQNPALKSDRIHPSGEGYRIVAESVYRLLKSSGAL